MTITYSCATTALMTHHLVGTAEVAALLGVTRQRVHQLAQRPTFPRPEVEIEAGKVWSREAIETWRSRLTTNVMVPERDPERPQDDPWDANAVRYLLGQSDVAAAWKRGPLMECLRRQPNRVKNMPDRVDEAARLATKYGVEQRREGQVIHFYRTDPDAPEYPRSTDERRALLQGQAPVRRSEARGAADAPMARVQSKRGSLRDRFKRST